VSETSTPPRQRLKYLAHLEMGQSPPSGEYSATLDSGLPFLQGTADFGAQFPEPHVFCASPSKTALTGDILFSVRAPVGELNVANRITGIGRGLCAIRPALSLHPGFAWWALHEARHQLNYVSTGSTYEAVSTEDVANLLIVCSPRETQRAIADYLDRETARIDALMAAKERWLALLAEKRRALITRAVTRGLDPHAPLRDSGIPWLGEIPAHWEIWKVGHFATVGNGSTPSRSNADYWTDGTVPWLNSGMVNQDEVTSADQFITETALRECHLSLVQPGSILIGNTGQGKTRGQATLLSIEATINQNMNFVSPNNHVADSRYLRWAFFAAYQYLRGISDDSGRPEGALTREDLVSLRLPLPPLTEQCAIVVHIKTETTQLDALTSTTKRTLSLLQEHRAALIAAAVTGQLMIEGDHTYDPVSSL
jgi:type I restriction enzyme, S subunit